LAEWGYEIAYPPVDVSTRAALIARCSPYLQPGTSLPQSWAELPLTVQLLIESNDPEAAAVYRGVMPAELEAQVLAGKWSAEGPAPRDWAAEKAAAIEAALASLPAPLTPEQQAAKLRERQAELDAARRNSYVSAYGQWGG
jgi:hypothetical protein